MVSAFMEKTDEYERDENRMRITILFRKPSARRCAPAFLISLHPSLSVLSVQKQKEEDQYEKDENTMRLTELNRKASPKCCPPIYPILLC